MPYHKSKTLAERAAWDFVKALPEQEKFELVTINPGFVMGPCLRKESCTSGDFLKNILEGKMPAVPPRRTFFVDVREVAEAHILGLKKKEAAGNRYILVQDAYWMSDLAQILREKYTPLGWPVTATDAPKPEGDKLKYADNSASKKLGVNYRPFKDTIIDMAEKMIELGAASKQK